MVVIDDKPEPSATIAPFKHQLAALARQAAMDKAMQDASVTGHGKFMGMDMGFMGAEKSEPRGALAQVVDKATSLQRRHFRIISDIVSGLPGTFTRDELAVLLANRLRSTSSKFDREKFLEACKP